MGNLYRVFFYHFPHAVESYLFPYLNCGASLLYLFWRGRNPARALAADAFATRLGFRSNGTLHNPRPRHRHALGPRRLGHLVDVGRPPHHLPPALAAVRQLHSAAPFRHRPTRPPCCRPSSRSLQPSTSPSAICRSAGGVPSTLPRIFGGGPDAGIDNAMWPAVLWNVAGWLMWGIFILGLRYSLERRRQARAAAATDHFLGANPLPEAQ